MKFNNLQFDLQVYIMKLCRYYCTICCWF